MVYISCLTNTFRCKNCKLGGPQGWAFLSKIDKVDQRNHCPAQAVAAVGNAGLRHAEVESVCACVCSVPTEDQPLNEINRNMLQVVFFLAYAAPTAYFGLFFISSRL